MKKVVIALDYSPGAQKVAEAGYAFVKDMQAQVCLVHVVADAAYYSIDYSPIMGYEGLNTAHTLQLVEELKGEAGKFLEASAFHLKGSGIETRVLEGPPADAILEFAGEWGADLLIMGTHSRSGLEKLLMGNVASNVLKHTHVPLLVIPNRETAK